LIVFFYSESFKVCYAESFILFIRNAKKCSQLTDNPSDGSDGSSNSEHNLDNSDDCVDDNDNWSQDSFIISGEQNGTDTTMFDKNSSLPNEHNVNSRNTDNDRNTALQWTINVFNNIALSPAEMAYYENSYGSCPLYSVDDGTWLVAIPSPMLYRFRGKKSRNLNHIEYYSCIKIVKDRPDENDATPPEIQYQRRRKNQHTFVSVQPLKYMPTTTIPS